MEDFSLGQLKLRLRPAGTPLSMQAPRLVHDNKATLCNSPSPTLSQHKSLRTIRSKPIYEA